jgi:prepilin-type processing-associated H-X9-DG protein
VVIAIIAILAAILFPVFARARENARRASCSSNLKQLGLGLLQYGQDYDEKYPTAWMQNASRSEPSDWGTGDYWYWQQMAYPYIKSAQVMRCPSNSAPVDNTAYVGSPLWGSYGANDRILTQPYPIGSVPRPLSFASVQSPANIYMIMDAGMYVLNPYDDLDARVGGAGTYGRFVPGMGKETGQGVAACGAGHSGAQVNDCNSGRHFDGVNITFADGHVKWIRTSKVIAEAMKWNNSTGACDTDSQWNPCK